MSAKDFKDEVRKLIESGYSDTQIEGAGHAAIASLRLKFEEQMVAVSESAFRPKTPELTETLKMQQMEKQIESLKQELA